MKPIYFYDDARARTFEPFALTRPISTLRTGAFVTTTRWSDSGPSCFLGSPWLTDFAEHDAPAAANGRIEAGSLIVNSRFIPRARVQARGRTVVSGGRVCAVALERDLAAGDFADGTLTLDSLAGAHATEVSEIEGRWLENVWDLIGFLPEQLSADLELIAATAEKLPPSGMNIVGGGGVFAAEGAKIDPMVAFDTTGGPIHLGRDTTVASFTRLVGPLFVGEHSVLMGDQIGGSSIGDHCKVRGEMSNTVMLGYSNKGHAGFVGHSYLGRWVNLGAGTTTSNLKNTYGTVALWTPGGVRDSGLQFLGTLFGDHAKTGIGMMLTTGTVVGAGANIYGSQTPPKAVPPFAWGDSAPYGTFDSAKLGDVAERVMARRQVELGESGRRHLAACFDARWTA